ncbi:MAG: ABC transporter substrate-binding protein [Deltaproteobacteria bacterium]|nr:ABC transporter substrate-binding protein [Deltaproteobacteria bacterium]
MVNRNNKRRLCSTALLALVAFLGHGSPRSAFSQTVRLAYPSESATSLPLFVMKEAKLFKKYGLDADLVFITSSAVIIPAMLSGELHIAASGGPPGITATLQGGDIVQIAGIVNRMASSLVTLPEIKRPADLKGGKIGISRFGSIQHQYAQYILGKWGLDKDVNILQVGGQIQVIAALQAKGIQGVILTEPNIKVAESMGFKVLVDLSKEGAAYPHQAIISTKTFIRSKPETVKNFLKGYIDSLALIRRDKEFSIKVLGKYTRTSDRKVLDFTYDAYTENYYVDLKEGLPYPTLKGVQFILDQLAPTNPKAKSARPEDFVHLDTLKEIGDSGFLKEVTR